MLELNLDYSLLFNYFGISKSQIYTQYANKDFEEIMSLEAQNGNEKAKEYQRTLQDPDKLKDLFKLASPTNKLKILQNTSENELDELFQYLNPEELSLGLCFFTNEKLIDMASELPVEELSKLVLTQFSIDEVLKMMDETALSNFIVQTSIDKTDVLECFQMFETEQLVNIMQNSKLNEDYSNKSKKEILSAIGNLKDTEYNSLIAGLQSDESSLLIRNLLKKDDDYQNLFDNNDLVKPLKTMLKGDIANLLKNLDPEFLIPMVQELPLDLTQITLTQINTNDFAKVLANDFQEVLKSAVIFSNR